MLSKVWGVLVALVPGAGVLSWPMLALSWTKDGVVWVVKGLWGSAVAALKVPATWGFIAAVAFGGYLAGHALGARPAHGLKAQLSEITVKKDELTVKFHRAEQDVATLRRDLAEAEQRAKALEDKKGAAAPSAPTVKVKAKSKPQKKEATDGGVGGWSFKF